MQTAFCPAEGVIALPAPLHPQNRLRLSFFNIVAYIAPSLYSHIRSVQQRRARKGGARGGKVGFATPNAFPPRNLAHATVSP